MIKNEGFDSGLKIEIASTSEEYLEFKSLLKKHLEESYSKQISYLKTGPGYGVFKATTCGQFAELVVQMDCEDNRGNSSTSNWVGSSYVDGSKNVNLRFCVISAGFGRGTYDFAVLDLVGYGDLWQPFDVVNRFFDNEDSGNGNWTTYAGDSYSGTLGGCSFGTNTMLSFVLFPQLIEDPWNAVPLPNLGITYGVLGKTGSTSTSGYIYFDDEDNPNWNTCYRWSWVEGTGGAESGNIPNIMDVGTNTKLYIRKVN